jgi:hypothetical protein
MALNTYANLKTAIADWLNRSDAATVIDDFIDAAEARFKRNKALWEEVKATLAANAASVALPSGFREPIALYHDGDTYYGPLEIVSPEKIAFHRDRWDGATGVPKYAAFIKEGSAVLFAPAPDTSYSLTIHYKRAIDSLSSTQTTNWLLDTHPDIYLYGALVESAPYFREDERLPIWEKRLNEAIEEARLLKEAERFGGTLVARPRRALGE